MSSKSDKNGFTAMELLVVISITAFLLSIMVPAMRKARSQAKSVLCFSNLKQISIGFEMYLDDNNRNVFPLVDIDDNDEGVPGRFWYFGFEPAWSWGLPEGSRVIDRKLAKLYPYIRDYDSVEICPAFPYNHSDFKPKFTTKWMTYGINTPHLSRDLRMTSRKIIINFDKKIRQTNRAVLFADSAIVNYHQSPASPSNPMFEEWYYIQSEGDKSVHFRHNGKANVLYCDGHVEQSGPEPGSFDSMLPELKIGWLPADIKFE
jgi:prepilin-type processing-associated H-X9-DG protein/prepilin-type N-terminal cleavage/methylation domain-containing protein